MFINKVALWIAANCSTSQDALEAESDAVFSWLNDPYGTDAFVVGAHFRLLGAGLTRLRVILMLALLLEYKLSPLDLLKMMRNPAGWRFLWNRREEIIATVLRRKLKIGSRI